MTRTDIEMIRKILTFIVFSVIFCSLSALLKPKKRQEKIVGFASSHFTGNISYLYQKMEKLPDLKVFFVTGEINELQVVKRLGVDARYFMDFHSIRLFLETHAWITSHGPNYIPFFGWWRRILPFVRWKHGSKWVDVWHGLGWVHVERGKMLKDYDLGISTSKFFRNYYSEGNIRIAEKIKITGYPRNDPFMDGRWQQERIESNFKIPEGRKNILYAPTWGHKFKKKLFPWQETGIFLDNVQKFCQTSNCNFLIRMHPNWYARNTEEARLLEHKLRKTTHIFHVSPFIHRESQQLLFISAVLITDWSSIANDYILLNRPIIFLDTPFPTQRLVLTPEDRAGYIVKSKTEFFDRLKEAVAKPHVLNEERSKLLQKLYKFRDGKASERCIEEILRLLDNQ